jgi:hypothetical protein
MKIKIIIISIIAIVTFCRAQTRSLITDDAIDATLRMEEKEMGIDSAKRENYLRGPESIEFKNFETLRTRGIIQQRHKDSCLCLKMNIYSNSEIIKDLGNFHKTMGTCVIILSSLEITGLIIYGINHKETWNEPTTYMVLLPIVVTFYFGMWEINIGKKLNCYKSGQ